MRKTVFLFLILCVCTGAFSQQMPVVAVAPFEAISGISAEDASIITRVFFIRLGNTNSVSLVDRAVVERTIQEQNFQAGDWSNPQKTAELNEGLNANWIVRGQIERFTTDILVTVEFYNVSTFRFMGGIDIRIEDADEAYDKMDPIVDRLIQTIASSGTRPQTTGTTTGNLANRTYNIGDRGPAGGIIFHDRGFVADGWRYLEAAPTDFTAQWGLAGVNVTGTDVAIGSGKRNTQIIVDRLRLASESNRAAQICAAMEINGFNDWFLPSRDELNLMYINLSRRGLGGFASSWYLSSSQSVYNTHSRSGRVTSTNYCMWSQRFSDGFQSNAVSRGNAYSIRAIRAF